VADIEDEDTGWHNRQPVLWAAGVAAVVLLALLVFAVIQMSQGPTSTPPQPGEPLPSYATSGSATPASTTATSYPVPSAQTSEDSPSAGTPVGTPPDEVPDPDTSSSTPTTIFNPYVTTTQPAAGHV
jgi:cytoskeletal protein RodZ